MNNIILIGASALFLAACSKSEAAPPTGKPAIQADNAATSTVVMELGKDI